MTKKKKLVSKNKMGKLKSKMNKESLKGFTSVILRKDSLAYLPPICLVLLAFAIIIAPSYVPFFLAAFLLSSAVLLYFVVRKALQLKEQLTKITKGFEGHILIHRPDFEEIYTEDTKKIVVN